MKHTFIITDANHEIGLGHLIRQAQLYRFLSENKVNIQFISLSAEVYTYCKENNFQTLCFPLSIDEIKEIVSGAQVIIDIHERDFPIFRPLSEVAEKTILIVSEVGSPFEFYGNHVIKIGSELEFWDKKDYVSRDDMKINIHSGRAWMLFKKEFENVNQQYKKENYTVLIAHGGSDPYDLSILSLNALNNSEKKYTVNILARDSFKNIDLIKEAILLSKHDVNLVINTTKPEVWMRKSTVSIINGGNIRYEVCLTETPFVAISFRELQYTCTQQISGQGIGFNLGIYNQILPQDIANSVDKLMTAENLRSSMIKKMDGLFDFKGPSRIKQLLE